MNTKKEEKRVREFLQGMDWMFGTQNYDKSIIFEKENKPDDSPGLETTAQITQTPEYMIICVRIYPCFWKHSLEKQRKILLHELCHTFTVHPYQAALKLLDGQLVTKEQLNDITERETTEFENILDALLKGRLRYAKEAYANYLKK